MKQNVYTWIKVFSSLSLDQYINHLITCQKEIVSITSSGYSTRNGEIISAIILVLEKEK